MIKSKEDYKFYLEADRIANSLPKNRSLIMMIKNILLPNYTWEFQKLLRKVEYYKNCKKDVISTIYRFLLIMKYHKFSMKLGFTIPANVLGPGLSIAHYGQIAINTGAKIGANCRLHVGVNIGTKAGYGDKAPFIGDNCYIGPGAKIFGKIYIADGIAIGANAVVNKSFDEPNITIAGVPAKKIANVDTLEFIIPATQIIEQVINKNSKLAGLSAKELREILKAKNKVNNV
jgi:serine O-acetyltransferase